MVFIWSKNVKTRLFITHLLSFRSMEVWLFSEVKMPNGGGKKLRTPRQESIMRMKKDPQQLASMERHCSNKMNSNSWRCEQLRQAQLEMYLG